MTDTTEIAATSEPTLEMQSVSESTSLATLRMLFASVFSAGVPGAGHLLFGQLPKGMLLSALFIGLLCCFFPPLRLLRYYSGFIGLYLTWMTIGLYACCSTAAIPNRKTGTRLSMWWLVLTLPIAILVIAFGLLGMARISGFLILAVPSNAMEPSVQTGDRIMVDTRAFRAHQPQYRDVIVFYRDRTYFVKRIIALGGDTIEGRQRDILINGTLTNESYVEHSKTPSAISWELLGTDSDESFGPVDVPADKYFVMGDNRDVSIDSRSSEIGFVDRASIAGKVLYVSSAAREGSRVR